MPSATLSFKKLRDPALPAPPVVHPPDRCMNCLHPKSEHNIEVGCVVEGGTKYIENAAGEGFRVCSCEAFVPAPVEEQKQ